MFNLARKLTVCKFNIFQWDGFSGMMENTWNWNYLTFVKIGKSICKCCPISVPYLKRYFNTIFISGTFQVDPCVEVLLPRNSCPRSIEKRKKRVSSFIEIVVLLGKKPFTSNLSLNINDCFAYVSKAIAILSYSKR